MSIKKLSFMLLSAISLAALLNGCGSSNKDGSSGDVQKVADEGVCITCHSTTLDVKTGTNIVVEYSQTGHNPTLGRESAAHAPGCEGCHGGGSQHNGVGPLPYPNPFNVSLTDRNGVAVTTVCETCHVTGTAYGKPAALWAAGGKDFKTSCAPCHTDSGVGSVHGVLPVDDENDCIKCHSVAGPDHSSSTALVNDNNGVRAITGEFQKWSHHVTGVSLNPAHCTACHLEGTVVDGQVVVDHTKHMSDNKTHLRNADTDADFAWDPSAAAPDFTGMDNFCMSCHDSNGATSAMSIQIQKYINKSGINAAGKQASALNPFGDTISNRYDKMQRPAVVNAKDQFATSNNSHHAVRGKKYSGRTRVAGATRAIASPSTFANNSTALLKGARSTIYDAGNFNALYVPLGTDGTAATGLGDDSTLHCGDCHTVGQWKVGSSVTANGSPTPVAIGAHGSNNEYLLRNSIGTDERHTQNAFLMGNIAGTVTDPATGRVLANGEILYTNPNGAFLVCYNCHSYSKYGSLYLGTGLGAQSATAVGQPHAGEYDQAGRCNGIGNTLPFNGYTTGTATDGTQFSSRFMTLSQTSAAPYLGEQAPDFGNVFGIQCANCHNSGAANAYGGIHGSANNMSWNNGTTTIAPSSIGTTPSTGGYYIDGMGNVNKMVRFLPGLGNAMHVPGTLGGFSGGSVIPTGTANPGGPAYTYISGGISNDTNWEQKGWQQTLTTVFDEPNNATYGTLTTAGAGCYTLGASQVTGTAIKTADVTSGLVGPSQSGSQGAATTLTDNWGGCDDHTAGQAKGNHGFVKRIVRPVTY